MMSMEERREAIQAQLQGGKRMTLRELATAIGVETERTRTAVRRMCELGEMLQECDGLQGQRGVSTDPFGRDTRRSKRDGRAQDDRRNLAE